ncbi:hypothetical protein [Streptomyces sp. NPDC059349]|uniref:hypothetical protein n=1 Tax=Streptomyces sp. NPDC059349 TaxID=3346808 RepID=UPI0036A21B14
MADATAVFSMISGLGEAALGALAGVYGPVLLERRQHSTQQSGDAHTTVATARQAGHAWLRAVHRAVQDLQAGRAVDIADFDQVTEATMKTVTAAVTELARPSVELHRVPSGAADLTGPVIARMWEITRQLRKVVLALADASWLDDIEAQAQKTRDALGYVLQREIEARIGRPLHVVAAQGPAAVYGYPPPYSPATPPNVPPSPPGDSSATNQP